MTVMQYLTKFVSVLFEGRSGKFKIPPMDHYRKTGKSVYGGHGDVFSCMSAREERRGGGEEKEKDRLK